MRELLLYVFLIILIDSLGRQSSYYISITRCFCSGTLINNCVLFFGFLWAVWSDNPKLKIVAPQ